MTLQVQRWRSTYETSDIAPDYLVIDGSVHAQITGDNAYPALEDPAKASAAEERLGILRRTLVECLVADYN